MHRWIFIFLLTIAPSPGLAQTVSLPAHIVEGDTVRMFVSGLEPGKTADLIVRRVTAEGSASESRSSFVVAADGLLDPERDPAVSGDYQGVDPAGPFWSMRPITAQNDEVGRLTVSVQVDGLTVAQTEAASLTLAATVVTEDIFAFAGARLYRPAGSERLPIIIVLGGSEGGSRASRSRASRLAALGYAALALPYYKPSWSDEDLPGLPEAFADIPVDRLEAVHEWIVGRDDLDAARVGLYGVSKGGEFALIAATRFQWLRAVAAIVPSDVVWEGWGTDDPDGARSSFAWRRQPLPFVPYIGMTEAINAIARGELRALVGPHLDGRKANPARAVAARIPVERYCGALLLAGGDQDMTWPSGEMVRAMAERRADVGLPTTALSFTEAGHSLSDTGWSPTNFQGNQALASASSLAQRQVWDATRTFFAEHLAAPEIEVFRCSVR